MEEAEDFINKQIKVAGEVTPMSTIKYYDNNKEAFCAYCGGPLESTMIGGFHLKCKNNCFGYTTETASLARIDELELKKSDIEFEIEKEKNSIRENALKTGRVLVAKHYMENKQQRDEFDNKIAEMTK